MQRAVVAAAMSDELESALESVEAYRETIDRT